MSAKIETQATPRASIDPPLPIPLARALSELMAGLGPVAPSRVPLAEANGFVLATPLLAPGPVPPRPLALRPGFAIWAEETAGATPYSPALLSTAPVRVEAGDILTGQADAVLPEDAVSFVAGAAEAFEAAAPGQWTRRIGEDARAGTVVKAAGEVLSGLDLAVAREAGLHECEVRRPSVALIRSSSHGGPARAGLDDLLRSLCGGMGADVIDDGSFPRQEADLVLAVAGAGGAWREAQNAGGDLVAATLALRPGEDGCLARLGDVPMVVLPDSLSDVLALWLCVAAPCLRVLTGAGALATRPRPLTRKIASTVGLAEVVLLRAVRADLEPIATGDLPLSALAAATHWHLVPPESEGYAAGTLIVAEWLPGR